MVTVSRTEKAHILEYACVCVWIADTGYIYSLSYVTLLICNKFLSTESQNNSQKIYWRKSINLVWLCKDSAWKIEYMHQRVVAAEYRWQKQKLLRIRCVYICTHNAQPFVCIEREKEKGEIKQTREKMLKFWINSLANVKINFLICNEMQTPANRFPLTI